jgi:hypothetical protein
MNILFYPISFLFRVTFWLCLLGICAAAIAVFFNMSKCVLPDSTVLANPIKGPDQNPSANALKSPTTTKSNPKEEATPETKPVSNTLNSSRPVIHSYLSFPKWYRIDSATAYANFAKLPSEFPYFNTIAQYWCSYRSIHIITRRWFPEDQQFYARQVFEDLGFSIQYALKGLYENTIGKLTENLNQNKLSVEDIYATKIDKEYAQFLSSHPWYEFSFWNKIPELWKENSISNNGTVRSWERKIMLSVGLASKAFCAFVFEKISFVPEADTKINVQIENASETIFTSGLPIQKVKELNKQSYIIGLPTHQAFTETLLKLAKQKVHFVEIAGNNQILITVTAANDWKYNLPDGKFLFSMNNLMEPKQKYMVIAVPVKALQGFLANLENNSLKVEHIYDY